MSLNNLNTVFFSTPFPKYHYERTFNLGECVHSLVLSFSFQVKETTLGYGIRLREHSFHPLIKETLLAREFHQQP